MDTRIRHIDPAIWQRFKLQCVLEDISMNSKILQLVGASVEAVDAENRQLAQAFSKGLKKIPANAKLRKK